MWDFHKIPITNTCTLERIQLMFVDSINSAAAAVYASSQAGVRGTTNQSAQTSTSAHNSIEDTITLSDQARRFAVDLSNSVYASDRVVYGQYTGRFSSNVSSSTSDEYATYGDMMLQRGQSQREYVAEKEAYDHARASESRTIMENLNKESGGLLRGTAFSDDLSKPITTTSGAPHPNAEQIRSFLMKHQTELGQMEALNKQSFPSFEEWQASKA